MSTHDGTVPANAGRRAEALQALALVVADAELSDLPGDLQRVCRAATSALDLAGAVVHMITGPATGAVVAASDEASRALGEIAFATGEGPSVDAFAQARPVLVPDLLNEGASRWPGYVDGARHLGFRSCFSLPLHVGAVRLGVLDLYGDTAGGPGVGQLSLALTFADLATERLLAGSPGRPDTLDGALLAGPDRRSEIHQAQGMVTVDLGVDLAEALSLMRANAFGRDLSLIDVAREILSGQRLPEVEHE